MTATDLAMRPLGGTRVLVAEGDPDGAATLTAVLRLNGFDAREARTTGAVFDMMSEVQPSVLVIDLDMTNGAGCELIWRVRSLLDPPTVIVVTAHTSESVRRAATAAGAAAFLLKPADPVELVWVVERLSGGRE